MDDVTAAILPIVIEVIAPALGTLIAGLAAMLLNDIRRKVRTEAGHRLLDRLERCVDLAVREVDQTLVPAARAAAADGKLDINDALRLRETAAMRARALMGPAAIAELRKAVPDISQVVEATIEAKVRDLRDR